MSLSPDTDDLELVARAAKGDERAFTWLMRRYKEGLYRFIRRYTGPSDEAYDILQETFAAAWSGLARFDRQRPLGAWLRSIALNKCRDWSRRRAVRSWLTRAETLDSPLGATLSTSELSPEADLIQRQRLAQVDAAIAGLPAGLKEPLILTQFEKLSQQEAGRLLGMSAKAVEVRVYRARRALAAALDIPED